MQGDSVFNWTTVWHVKYRFTDNYDEVIKRAGNVSQLQELLMHSMAKVMNISAERLNVTARSGNCIIVFNDFLLQNKELSNLQKHVQFIDTMYFLQNY